MEKKLLNGVIVVALGLLVSQFVPGISTGFADDSVLTAGELVTIAGEFLVLIGTGVVRFFMRNKKKTPA